MEIFRTIEAVRTFSKNAKRNGKTIALVPTMGFLHEGHLSLIDLAKTKADLTIVSIFVNPTQFGPTEDLDKYPRDFQRDKDLCEARGAAAIFAPSAEEMYANNRSTWIVEENLSKPLCGKSRPIHFRGVCTVVGKLFNIVLPDFAVFGQKDAQQSLIIKRMVRDLNFPLEIIVAPIVRDIDKLALSSRNKYLSSDHRKDALAISSSLFAAQAAIEASGTSVIPEIIELIKSEISKAHGVVDYVECLDNDTLSTPTSETSELLLAAAAKFGETRLIDNLKIQVTPCKN